MREILRVDKGDELDSRIKAHINTLLLPRHNTAKGKRSKNKTSRKKTGTVGTTISRAFEEGPDGMEWTTYGDAFLKQLQKAGKGKIHYKEPEGEVGGGTTHRISLRCISL